MSETIKCKFCGEEIKAEARKCKHCGEWFEENAEVTNSKKSEKGNKKVNYFIACFFSAWFFLASLYQINIGNYVASLGFFLFSLVLLPHFNNLIKNKLDFTIKMWHKVLTFLISFALISWNVTNYPVSTTDMASTNREEQTFNINDQVDIGYMSYRVNGIKWTQLIGDSTFGQKANSSFLIVNVTARNNDNTSRMIPEFTLIDENNNKYETANETAIYLGDEAFIFDSLNPAVSKTGLLVFDVPENNKYKLVVSGGYMSGGEAYINLN